MPNVDQMLDQTIAPYKNGNIAKASQLPAKATLAGLWTKGLYGR